MQEIGRSHSSPIPRHGGKIEGGVSASHPGFALYELVAWKNGRMANGQMTNYIMPTSADLPPIRDLTSPKIPTPTAPPAQKASANFPWTA